MRLLAGLFIGTCSALAASGLAAWHAPGSATVRPGAGCSNGRAPAERRAARASLSHPWLPLLLAGVASLVLAACANRPASGRDDGGLATRDLVTASDQSEASKRAAVRMELAVAYFGRGEMTTALDQVKLAIVADPTLASAFNLRGLIYANLGEDTLAEQSFRHALQLDPKDGDSMQNFGYYLCQKKRFAEADGYFDQALGLPRYRQAARTWLTKGVCEAIANQLPESEASLLRAHELDPTNPSISVNLSEVLLRRGDYERARFYVRRVNAQPGVASAQTLWLAARIENRLGNASGTREFGDQLQHRFPDSREAASYARGDFQ